MTNDFNFMSSSFLETLNPEKKEANDDAASSSSNSFSAMLQQQQDKSEEKSSPPLQQHTNLPDSTSTNGSSQQQVPQQSATTTTPQQQNGNNPDGNLNSNHAAADNTHQRSPPSQPDSTLATAASSSNSQQSSFLQALSSHQDSPTTTAPENQTQNSANSTPNPDTLNTQNQPHTQQQSSVSAPPTPQQTLTPDQDFSNHVKSSVFQQQLQDLSQQQMDKNATPPPPMDSLSTHSTQSPAPPQTGRFSQPHSRQGSLDANAAVGMHQRSYSHNDSPSTVPSQFGFNPSHQGGVAHSRTSSASSNQSSFMNAVSSAGGPYNNNMNASPHQRAVSNVPPPQQHQQPKQQQQQQQQFFSPTHSTGPSSTRSSSSQRPNYAGFQQGQNFTPASQRGSTGTPQDNFFQPTQQQQPSFYAPPGPGSNNSTPAQGFPQQQQHPQFGVMNASPPLSSIPSHASQHQQQHSNYHPAQQHTFSPGHALHPRQQSSEFSFDINGIAQTTMDEKLHNLSHMEAKPIVTCGFGGKLVVMFPKRATKLNVMDTTPENSLPYSRNGEIQVYSLCKLLSNTDYGRALNQYPGIFSDTQKDTIVSYITQIIMQYDRNVSVMGKSLSPEQLVEKQLWELLRLFVNIEKLTEDAVEDTLDNVKRVLLSHKNELDNWSNGTPSHHTGNTSNSSNDMNMNPNAPVLDLQHQHKHIAQMQKNLIDGRIEQACDIACSGHMWGHALLLASMIDKPTYTKVVTQFASNAFCHGSPLKTLYMMFADRGDLLFQPESQQLTDAYGNHFSSASHQQQQAHQQQVDKLCKNWQENLSIIIANRTSSSGEVIEKLGDALWREHNMVQSAHFCYLVGEFCTNFSNINNRVVLVGADHRNARGNAGTKPFVDVHAIQRSEIYHYYKKKHDPNHIMPSFMVFRLVYAHWLAEIGQVSLAASYVDELHSQVENLKNSVSFNYTFLRQLKSLHDRIKGAGGSGKRGSSSSGKSFFSSIFSRVDSTINNMMSSEPESPKTPGAITQQPATPNTKQQQQQDLVTPKKQNQNQSNNAAPASRSESSKQKSGGWLGWFSGKKKKKGANLGTANTRRWSEKLQRYIPKDADEDTYVDQGGFDAPPPSMSAPSMETSAPPPTSNVPVFNSMTSRRYGSSFGAAPPPGMQPPMGAYRPQMTPSQMFVPNPQASQPQAPSNDTASSNSGGGDNIPLNAPTSTFSPQSEHGSSPSSESAQQQNTAAPPTYQPPTMGGGSFFTPNAGGNSQAPAEQQDGGGQDNGYSSYGGWSAPSWGEGELKISGGYAEEPQEGK